MNYKLAIKLFFLGIICISYWFYVNRVELSGIHGIHTLSQLKMLYTSGYFNERLHGSVLVLLYLSLLFGMFRSFDANYMIRIRRSSYVFRNIRIIMIGTVLFVTIYSLVRICLVLLYVDTEIWMNSNLFLGEIMEVISEFFYYAIWGMVFLNIYLLFSSKSKAFIGTVVVSSVLLGINIIYGYYIWTPIENVGMIQSYFSARGIHVFELIKNLVLSSIILYLLGGLGVWKIKKKDIIINAEI